MKTWKPTSKQQAFVDAILQGNNQSDAYRLAYDTDNMLPETITRNAAELIQNNNVATMIDERQQRLSRRKEWDLDKIVAEAETNLHLGRELQQVSAANTALAFIGEATGLVSKTVKVEHSGSVEHTLSLDQVLLARALADQVASSRGLPAPFAETVDQETGVSEKQWQQPPGLPIKGDIVVEGESEVLE